MSPFGVLGSMLKAPRSPLEHREKPVFGLKDVIRVGTPVPLELTLKLFAACARGMNGTRTLT